MRHPRRLTLVAALAASTAIVMPAASGAPHFVSPHVPRAVSSSSQTGSPPSVHRVGLPQGVPKAALQSEPRLPEPRHKAWPFPNDFPRTSGTGRLSGGASFWTDWLFDDHGAAAPTGLPLATSATDSLLAPTQGLASYPAGPARGNGADIFRTAVGVTDNASYWRVDWTTLINPDVPIAEWAFDTDNDSSTGSSAWPADAGVHSPGIDEALVVSAKAVQLINLHNGDTTNVLAHGGALTVDRASRSFVVRVPTSLLSVSGDWRVRLASGLASSDGRSFAPADYSTGIAAGQAALGRLARVYNVTFRTLRQEPPVYRDGQTAAQIDALQTLLAGTPINGILGLDGLARIVTGNFWMEDHQADALASRNIAPFSREIDWSALEYQLATPEPQPRGYSNRWYVSRLKLEQGVIPNAGGLVSTGDLRPNYLSRVQPYAVYVPRGVSLKSPLPMTWILHSLDVNLNQYGALDPRLIQQECQDRQSICATTEGFGPDGWYFDEAEQDFWSVWHDIAQTYPLDPTRTVMSGYSMGGWASYKLTLEHPDLFSQAMPLEGPPNCGIRIIELGGRQVSIPASAQSSDANTAAHCGRDGFTHPLLGNAKWVPYVVTQGGIDEFVPLPSDVQATDDMQSLGNRYRFFLLPADDHLAYATQDRFGGIVRALGAQIPKVMRNPGTVIYRWYPDLDVARLGIGATTAYWITRLVASTNEAGALASVRARSFGIAQRPITVVDQAPQVVANPLPAVETGLTWKRGRTPVTEDRLVLSISSVRAMTIDAARAGLSCPTVVVTADRPVQVTLMHLSGADGGVATLQFPAGSHSRQAC